VPENRKLDWTEIDDKAVDTVRVLAMDAVQKVGNGHPGTAMSLAPVAYLLFQKVMRHDPADPDWIARDRFVLSCGHTSLTLYLQLYLGGWGLELEDIKSLRTWGSKTPGHPEFGHTAGVETTTGPLGQGVGNAVGFAMASRKLRGLLDPEAAEGASPFDQQVYALCSDGDLEEGVSAEASSLAGTQRLGNLTLIYDDNSISIEDDTNIAFTEDVALRYEAYGWHVQTVDWTAGGGEYTEDVGALWDAIQAAEQVTDRPSFIRLKTIIAWPSPTKQGHGTFEVSPAVIEHTRSLGERAVAWGAAWDEQYAAWAKQNPEREALLHRMKRRELPEQWAEKLPTFPADEKGIATRKASSAVIQAIAATVPELWGGSADLAESNNTTIEGAGSFLPADRATEMWKADPLTGRVLHFGIREHAMGAIMNGIAAHSGTRVFGGTFLTFSDYMRGAVRLAALMQLPVIYVWTHDSIGLGEDGPTHQPVEHLAALRAIPGLDVVRPGDANETAACWQTIMENNDRPAGLILSRQNLPVYPRGEGGYATTEDVKKGGYVLLDAEDGTPDVVLVGTGSELQLAVQARGMLAEKGIKARVVSMPCREWFDAQEPSYRETVIPPTVKARVSVEAGVAQGWREIVGDHGRIVSLEHYGASADYARIFREFGITAESVAYAAEDSIRVATG
jgi:transketolase